jgi:tetratricopeptide (TPR) repeat protein
MCAAGCQKSNRLGDQHATSESNPTALNQQVIQLYNQGRYSEAIPLAQRTLAIVEKALGPDHPNVATALNNLADLYRAQGRYADAETLYKRSLAMREKELGPDDLNVALSLNNLAGLYLTQGRYADVEESCSPPRPCSASAERDHDQSNP